LDSWLVTNRFNPFRGGFEEKSSDPPFSVSQTNCFSKTNRNGSTDKET